MISERFDAYYKAFSEHGRPDRVSINLPGIYVSTVYFECCRLFVGISSTNSVDYYWSI